MEPEPQRSAAATAPAGTLAPRSTASRAGAPGTRRVMCLSESRKVSEGASRRWPPALVHATCLSLDYGR